MQIKSEFRQGEPEGRGRNQAQKHQEVRRKLGGYVRSKEDRKWRNNVKNGKYEEETED